MSKKIMILGAGPLQLEAIRTARDEGLDVIVADMNPNAIGFKERGISKEVISTIDTDRVLEAAKRSGIDGILTIASDVPIPTVAKVCEELGLNGVSSKTALMATNKAEMRKCFYEHGVPSPKFYSCRTLDEFLNLSKNFTGKFVVKASDNSGNRGVSLVNSLDTETFISAFEYAKKNTRDGRVVLEEYMDGPEFSVEGFSVNGEYHVIQVTDKMTSGAPYFVELGHTQPSAQTKYNVQAIKEVARLGVEALGITEGPSHSEIKLTSEGPKIVEIGARLGGGCITSHLVPLSTGVNMVKANIASALGETPDLKQIVDNGAAIRFFNADKGTIVRFEGIEEAKKVPGVVEVGFFKTVGDYVPELKTGLDRVGYVISCAENRAKAVEMCEEALQKVKVYTKN